MLNLAGELKNSLSNGPEMRYVLFLQGCPHHCYGCHNQHTWEFKNNRLMYVEDVYNMIINELPIISGVTFSGGEPFCQAKELYDLSLLLKKKGLNILCYTGFTIDEIKESNDIDKIKLLSSLDYLIDGKFEIDNMENAPLYRGSCNQKMYKLDNGNIVKIL